MAGELDASFDAIRAAVADEFEAAGAAMADEQRARVGVPVERSVGPRGGVIIRRSAPGEPPRRDRGGYQSTITHAVDTASVPLRMACYSTSIVGVYLDGGTSRMDPRPHWAALADDWAERLPSRVAGALRDRSAAPAA